jgi:DNA polymerase/3'-5' exonuclease PolX
MKTQLPYPDALAKAEQLLVILAPFFTRLEIAGSIRREKAECGDIELVGLPSNRTLLAMKLLEIGGVGCKKDARYIKFRYQSTQVDLFLPQPHDYGRQLAIRTGSAEYSHRVLATAWVKKGCKGTDAGLVDSSGKVIPFVSEEDFFSYLGLRHLDPKLRN